MSNGGGDGGAGQPGEEAGPVAVAMEFVGAVAWGAHRQVWELLGAEGRRAVLRVAVGRGMSEALSARLRDGTATQAEADTFLADLVNGLRADLAGNDLDAIGYREDTIKGEDGATWVVLSSPLPAELGGDVPVGTLELTRDGGAWRVSRLNPRPRG